MEMYLYLREGEAFMFASLFFIYGLKEMRYGM